MGTTKSKVFDSVEKFEDLRGILFQSLIENPHMNYMNEQSLQLAIMGLQDMDEKCQKQVLRYARHVDRKFSITGTTRGNMIHKLPAVLAGSIYLKYYPDKVKDLTLDELVALSRFSIVEQPSFYEGAVDYLGQDLLTAITKKHFDYMFQTTFLDYAESKIRNGESKETVATYIKEIPIERLKEESFEYERQVLEEVGQYI